MGSRAEAGVRLVPEGLAIGDEVVPLWAASVHYWHLDPDDWRPCLEAVRRLGYRLVDTYVPWGVHEVAAGVLDLGTTDPRKDVARFLRLAAEVGLHAIVRPGPHINGELTYFGIPERVVWDPACQALGPNGHPVMLPMIPVAFPVPSYASQAFHDEVARWFERLGQVLAPLVWPAGPIVMIQVDNEGAYYFRDGAYDQDWHPDAIALYRQFLRDKYRTLAGLAAAYGFDEGAENAPRFGDIMPPTRFDAETPGDVARHLDWAELHEVLLATSMTRMGEALTAAGFGGIPRSHNFPPGQETTPLNAARVAGAVDLIGLDYYNAASERSRATIMRRTTELAVRTEARKQPAFAAEMGAGFPPFFPPLDEKDSAFTVLCALAYGLRGFNTYMVVERDRWIGAPLDPHGRERPFAAFWRKLIAALDAVGLHRLRRRVPVRIVTPRNERRLARVTHAFGPVSGAFFSIAGAGARDACLEDEVGLGGPPAIDVDTFVRAIEEALEARGVPFAHVGGEDKADAIEGASWIVCATSGGLSPVLFEELVAAAGRGAAVTLGPRAPELGGARRPLRDPLDLDRLSAAGSRVPRLLGADPRAVDAAVAAAVESLALPTWSADPDGVHCTVHEDADGVPRVLFVIRGGDGDGLARVTVGAEVRRAHDPLEDRTIVVHAGVLELRMPPRTVRMLRLET